MTLHLFTHSSMISSLVYEYSDILLYRYIFFLIALHTRHMTDIIIVWMIQLNNVAQSHDLSPFRLFRAACFFIVGPLMKVPINM